jgi:hypothetical protein
LNVVIGGVHVYPVAEVLSARGIPFAFASGVPQGSIDEDWRKRPYLSKPYLIDDLRRFLTQSVPSWRGPTDPGAPAAAGAILANPIPVQSPVPPEG